MTEPLKVPAPVGTRPLSFYGSKPITTVPLMIRNRDGSDYVRLEEDGTVSGEVVEKYPDAAPAIAELMSRFAKEMGLRRGD